MALHNPNEPVPVFDEIFKTEPDGKFESSHKFLKIFLAEYVHRHGLGGMAKSDLDALLVHLFLKCTNKSFNAFELSEIFRVKESRIKSLMEIAAVKFEEKTEQDIWMEILTSWREAKTEIESVEKGHVTFKFENPAYFRFLQKQVRKAKGTVAYLKNTEAVTISLSTLFEMLKNVHDGVMTDKVGFQGEIKALLTKMRDQLFDKNELKKIQEDKEKKNPLTRVLSDAANLSTIGSLIKDIFFKPLP